MPPKENKGKKPPPKPECIAPPEAQPPDEMSPEFYLNQIAELEVCVERYQELYKTLLEKSEELQTQLDEQKKDSKNTFIEAKKKFEDKVVEIANLEDEIKEMESTIEREHEEHKALLKQKEKEYKDTEEQLTADNQEIMAQLAVIEEFKLHREELQERITSLEDEIAQREQVNRAQLDQQDREQVDAKNKLKKDILMHVTDVASDYRRKADARLPPTTERLLLENYQLNVRVADMYDEMRLLRQQSVEWKDEDDRQVKHMRQLAATNAHTTHTNITLAMVIKLMRDKIAYLRESMDKYRPRDPNVRNSLAAELQYLEEQLAESRDILNASTSKKEDVEKRALELRYELAIQRAAGIQLERALRDATTAVSRLLDRQIRGDCVDMAPAAKQRSDVIVSFLLILRKAREHHLGPSLREVVHAPHTDVSRHLGYRSTERFADVGYDPGDLGIVPRPSTRLPTRRDGMRRLMAAQRRQAHILIEELAKKPTDRTTSTLVRQRFFEGRRDSMKGRAALAVSRAKYLLASKPTH